MCCGIMVDVMNMVNCMGNLVDVKSHLSLHSEYYLS